MLIETDTSIYETFFHHAQIEITGCCNMNCEHCRANMEKKIFMPLDKIEKILFFSKKIWAKSLISLYQEANRYYIPS